MPVLGLIKDIFALGAGVIAFTSTELLYLVGDFMHDIPLEDLKDEVLEKFRESLEELPVEDFDSLYPSGFDEELNESIEIVIKERLEDVPPEEQEKVLDHLYNLITPKETSEVVDEVKEQIDEMMEYKRNPLRWHGLSPRDFY